MVIYTVISKKNDWRVSKIVLHLFRHDISTPDRFRDVVAALLFEFYNEFEEYYLQCAQPRDLNDFHGR